MIWARKIWGQISNLHKRMDTMDIHREMVEDGLENRLAGLEIAFDNLVEYLKLDYNDDCVFVKRKKKK